MRRCVTGKVKENIQEPKARLRSSGGLWFLLLLTGLLALAVGALTPGSAPAHAAGPPQATPRSLPTSKVPTAVSGSKGPAPLTPPATVTSVLEANFTGWERPTLRDLAEIVGWPTAVAYDSSGRLQVENRITDDEWGRAHIRAFDYSAGAEAGFAAEQEDARLGGFSVAQDTFFTYPSYVGLLRDGNGNVVERRFRWLASTWILGVDLRGGQAASDSNVRQIAEELLSIAVWRGLPPPQSGTVPTPNPTWSLPPLATPTGQPCTVAFTDVTRDYWAYQYISRLACDNVVNGYSDGTFRPENPTTRAQLAKILILAMGWPLADPSSPTFDDVPASHPFYRYIETAAEHHVVSGYADGNFHPDAYVTRAQVAKMLVVAGGWTLSTQGTVQLRDVPMDYWAWSYIQTAVQHGLFTGYGDNYFRPSMLATRAQLAKVLVVSVH